MISMQGRRGKDQQTTGGDGTPCMPGRAEPGGLVSTHCQEGSFMGHESTQHRGELKVKSDKRIRQHTTEKEPGLCQVMAGFKRNEFFLSGG